MRVTRRHIAIACAMLLFGCEETRSVRVSIDLDAGIQSGFSCLDSERREPLAMRAFKGGRFEMSLVVDFVSLGGQPFCNYPSLAAWCSDPTHGCGAVHEEGRWACLSITASTSTTGLARQQELRAAVEAKLRDRVVASDAPDDWVLARVIGTTETCDAVKSKIAMGAKLLADQLIGCATSCPVVLDDYAGDLALRLYVLEDTCENSVIACATLLADD